MGVFDYVMLGLGALGVTCDATRLSETRKILPASKQLVDIGLVTGIENHCIGWRIEHSVHSESDLDYAQVWSQVAASLRDGFNQERADLLGQLLELALAETL